MVLKLANDVTLSMCVCLSREAFLMVNVVDPLSDLMDEPVAACRSNMHRALKMVAEFPAGVCDTYNTKNHLTIEMYVCV